MVACRSCGRNISSGTIRCSKCQTPFHLSCSHRYKISPEGVFNVCCGPENSVFPGSNYQMRTRNKRRRQQNSVNSNNFNAGNGNANQPLQTDSMRYGKIQKTEEKMGISDKPLSDAGNNSCTEVLPEIIQEDFTENVFENENEHEHENENENENNEAEDTTIIIHTENSDEPTQSNSENLNTNNRNNESNNSVTLETVWQGIAGLQTSISNISNSLDTVSTHLNTFDPRMNELESTLNTIKTKTTSFENVQNDVSGLKDELERVMKELENIKSMTPDKNFDMSEILIEINEREMKSRNILIYNVPEDNLRISQDYSTLDDINKFNALVAARDNSRAREILQNIPDIDLDDLQTRRLGRINPNVCRPLRVTLQCKDDVITVMKNRNLVGSPYNIKTDLTRYQQKKIRELKEELENSGVNRNHPTMTIKFVNGEPKIIPLRGNFKRE